MTFLDQLQRAAQTNRSLLCVGLDPEPKRFPARMQGDASRIYDFCAAIVGDLALPSLQVSIDSISRPVARGVMAPNQ